MPGYSNYIGLVPSKEIIRPINSTTNQDTLANNVAHNDVGNPAYTYLYQPFYGEIPNTAIGCKEILLFEIPSREYNYVKVLFTISFKGGSSSIGRDALIDFRATWNTPGLAVNAGVISQETVILLPEATELSNNVCLYPETNLSGMFANMDTSTSSTIKVYGFGVADTTIKGIYEII